MRLAISLLGPIHVTLEPDPAGRAAVTRFRLQAAQALLAYLVMHAGTALRRQVLAGLLWPDHPESEALVNLRQALRRLRQAIRDDQASPPFLIATRTTLALNGASDYWLDVDAFAPAVAADATMESLSRAADLYRGEFLQGFSLPSALYEEWMVVERERLHGQALHVLGRLADQHEAQGEYARALRAARRQVELEPWRESAHRQCMRCLAASGQRPAAVAQYEACRKILVDELCIEPEPETIVLYERIRGGLETPAAPSGPSHNLPAQLTPFVGREGLLAETTAYLEDPACRLLTLVGPGGSGKTRLALEAAAGQLDRFADGVYLVSLAPLQSVEAIAPTIAQAIGYSMHAGDAREQLHGYLQRKEMLLVLDNHEHLVEGASVATGILRAATGVRILATSRAALNVPGEQLLAVSGLAYPARDSEPALQEAAAYGAVRLFVHTARRHKAGLQLSADSLPHVVRICHLLRGMPLGIVLAASWTAMLSPAEIERELASQAGGLDFLETDLQDVPARQRSMRAVFAYSWALLAERERHVLQALSVFRGGFTREAAQAVAGASLRDLMALIRRSLLHRTPSGRYEVHELLRQYAAEKLDQAWGVAEREQHGAAARDRHCAYYTAALAGWEADLKSARQQAALAEIDVEIDNLRAAWAWAVERGHVGDLERAAEGLSLYCELRSLDPEGESAFRTAADRIQGMFGQGHMRPVEAEDALLALARMRVWTGVSACRWLHTEVARRALRQGLELLDRPELAGCDTRLERGVLLFTLGWLGFDTGREDVRQQLEESLNLFRMLDNRWWAGRALLLLGVLANEEGEYGSARRHYEEGLAAFQAQGDPRWSASLLGFTGVASLWQGQVEQGEPMVREALASLQALGDRAGVAGSLEGMSMAARLAGRFVEAEAWMERCLAIWDDLGTRRTTVMQNAGRVYMHLGQYERACGLGQEELALVQQRDQHRIAGMYLDFLGMASLPLGPEQAHRRLQEALVLFQRFGMRRWRANTEAVVGYAARAIGRPEQARGHLVEALRLAREPESWWPVALALPAIALLLADRGQVERAVELYALASNFPYVSNSRWFEDVAGKQLAAAAEPLPRDVVDRAQARGRARDLWATVEELLAEWAREQTP